VNLANVAAKSVKSVNATMSAPIDSQKAANGGGPAVFILKVLTALRRHFKEGPMGRNIVV
jgi:hypothetical protein